MSALVLAILILATLPLLFVASIQEATPASRTRTEMVVAVRQRGLLVSAAGLAWGIVMTVLLIADALLLTTTAGLAAIGGMR